MSTYIPAVWKDLPVGNTPILAAGLNRIEQGIGAASVGGLIYNPASGLVTSPVSSQPLPTVDPTTHLFPPAIMAALEAAIGGGGGGGSDLTYDSSTGFYDVADDSSLTYDPSTGLYTTA